VQFNGVIENSGGEPLQGIQSAAGFKMVNYSQLPLLLLQAIREQHEQIRELRMQVERLRAGK
jgi:hypothetical protein